MVKHLLARNWKDAISEVLASAIGTVGIVALISLVLFLQSNTTSFGAEFISYFSAGQLGLPILSVSAVVFIALRKHESMNPIVYILMYIFLILPTILTAFIIGLNPGFHDNLLNSRIVEILWAIFVGLHLLWLIILLLQPVLPTPQQADEEEAARVGRIKSGALNRG